LEWSSALPVPSTLSGLEGDDGDTGSKLLVLDWPAPGAPAGVDMLLWLASLNYVLVNIEMRRIRAKRMIMEGTLTQAASLFMYLQIAEQK
jgi:hypothetical protein